MTEPKKQNTTIYSGVGFCIIVFLVLFTMKLLHVIDWSWWLITMPLWFFPALAITITIVAIISMFFIKDTVVENY